MVMRLSNNRLRQMAALPWALFCCRFPPVKSFFFFRWQCCDLELCELNRIAWNCMESNLFLSMLLFNLQKKTHLKHALWKLSEPFCVDVSFFIAFRTFKQEKSTQSALEICFLFIKQCHCGTLQCSFISLWLFGFLKIPHLPHGTLVKCILMPLDVSVAKLSAEIVNTNDCF